MLFFERDIELWVTEGNGSTIPYTTANTVKIAVLPGSSISYKSVSQSVYNYKIETTPNRIDEKVLLGNTAPEFKFKTYAKPYNDTTNDTSVEKLLLKSLMGQAGTDAPTEFTAQFASTPRLPELNLFIKFGNLIYKISNAVVTLAEYSFEVNKILEVSWELKGLTLEKVTSTPGTFTDYTTVSNYIKTNYSFIDLTIGANNGKLPAISGKLKLKNDVDIVERNTLDIRKIEYLDHYVKARITELDFTGYMKTGSYSNLDLFERINSDIDYGNTNKINTKITFGKVTEPHITIDLPNSIVELPEIQVKDVITSNIKITSRKDTTDNDDTVVKYKT